MKTFWLSFAAPDRHLGVIVTEASDFMAAIRRTKRLGINPGGEVLGGEASGVDDVPQDRLLSADDILDLRNARAKP